MLRWQPNYCGKERERTLNLTFAAEVLPLKARSRRAPSLGREQQPRLFLCCSKTPSTVQEFRNSCVVCWGGKSATSAVVQVSGKSALLIGISDSLRVTSERVVYGMVVGFFLSRAMKSEKLLWNIDRLNVIWGQFKRLFMKISANSFQFRFQYYWKINN